MTGNAPSDEPQESHRARIIGTWSLPISGTILEIGCGQGDCTVVLANTVGPKGHVDAIDPASLDYGSPETLGQAQHRISQSEIGSRITWHQSSPLDFLASIEQDAYDVAVLCHSLWYFASPTSVTDTLRALRGKARRLCIAEYALSATHPDAVPHVLAALTRYSLEIHNPASDENIRTALAPSVIQAMAESVGWRLASDKRIVPDENLQDGKWETQTILKDLFLEQVQEHVKDEKINAVLLSMREAVKNAVQALGEKPVRTMDVWTAVFE
jgi:ubiquinone/menaquinone biosynthesis C-methylase UbiE